jgi:phage tail-like protein
MVSFSTWIFEQFPRYFKEQDTYKDGDDKGLLERFLGVLGDELDEEMIPSITNFTEIFNVETTPDQYFRYLAEMMGNPPDLFYNDARYRRFIKYLTDINKHKGTAESYDMLFRLFNCTVVIEEIPLVRLIYDLVDSWGEEAPHALLLHDSQHPVTAEKWRYDEGCPTCSRYNLHITDPERNLPLFEKTTSPNYILLKKIIQYVEPINMILNRIYIDTTPIPSNPWVLTTGVWDNGLYWDNDEFYRNHP